MPNAFTELAQYNRWANARLYEAALELPSQHYNADVGVFFRSLHGTLNHLLVTDRIWLRRLTGVGEELTGLNQILFEDRNALALARADEDDRIIAVVESYDEERIVKPFAYRTTSGQPQRSVAGDVLRHLFNHHAHHRGQAHSCISIAGREPPALDLLGFQRGMSAPDLRTIAAKGARAPQP
jgi:uncharacterized damage-inducible protein DinB